MRTQNVTHEGITITVASATLGNDLVAQQYRAALYSLYPEIGEFLTASRQIPTIKLDKGKDEDGDDRLVPNEADQIRYSQDMTTVIQAYPVGHAHWQLIESFVPLAARIVRVQGDSLFATDERGKFDVYALNEAYLSFQANERATADEPYPGLWGAVRKAASELDTPLTPKEQWPADKLSAEDAADPNSKSVMASGKHQR